MEIKAMSGMKIGKIIALGAGIVGLLVALSVLAPTVGVVGGCVVALAIAVCLS